MEQFLAACMAAGSPYPYWHLGDLLWSMKYSPAIDPVDKVGLWEDANGRLVGFVWYDGAVVLQVHPRLRGSGVLEEPMLAWATRRERETAHARDGNAELVAYVDEGDAAYTALFQRHGFERGEWNMVRMRRGLDDAIPAPSPPVGATIRPVREEEAEERVALHREAFHPSRFTLEAYRRLRAAPGYRPDLDLVAIAPDGALASYCIGWLDPVNGIGLFEPVGTRPAMQRQGFGKAVMLEGLRRLRDVGARVAFLHTGAAAGPAVKLYESVGFRIVAAEQQYRKRLER
jgi:ribosomal protein S18 acetylase RimI-like enzyme